MNDFIGVYPNAVSTEFCKTVIEFYNDCEKLNRTFSRASIGYKFQDGENDILSLEKLRGTNVLAPANLITRFGDYVWKSYEEYSSTYSVLTDLPQHKINPDIMIQKILPSEGYHGWHIENGGINFGRRLLALMVYLNDVEEGGETEFLYQQKRIPPTEGTLIIHPAGLTHAHRGNPPLAGVKYVINAWMEFVE